MRSILAFFLIAMATMVSSQEDDPFDITFYGSFLHTAQIPDTLFFFNDIEKDDSFELRRALRNHEIDTVVLASDGGNVREGLIMAGIIHDKSLKTYVPENLGCHSACAYMFFGGKIRRIDGALGVHQTGFYGSEADNSRAKISDIQISTQYTVSEVIGFLNEFETPPWVYEKMFRSRELYEFDEDEKKRLALRSDEIDIQKLHAINGFMRSFFEYLENLDEKTQEPEEKETPELSKEEELRLVVTEIQKLLNAAGCNAGVADGIWGRRTQAAAILFAKTAKLPTAQSALISEAFIERLRNAPSDFCPKPKPITKTKPNKFRNNIARHFHATYNFICSNSKLRGKFRINLIPDTTSLNFELSFNNGDKASGKIYQNRGYKLQFENSREIALRVKHSSAGEGISKVSTFSYSSSREICVGTIY